MLISCLFSQAEIESAPTELQSVVLPLNYCEFAFAKKKREDLDSLHNIIISYFNNFNAFKKSYKISFVIIYNGQ